MKGKKTQKVVLHGKIYCHSTVWFIFILVELYKNIKKYIGHEHSNIFGKALHWNRDDIERLIHKLILEGYLREEMVAFKSDIMNAYIRIGPEAEKLLTGFVKVIISYKNLIN